jgi:hypothetical protein
MAISVVLVANSSAQSPRITSDLQISGNPGDSIPYTIRATGDPVFFEATTESPSLDLLSIDNDTGRIEIQILPEAEESSGIVTISAHYEDDETAEADLVVTIRQSPAPAEGSPRAMVANLVVKPPRVDRENYELVSKFSLKGKFHRQLAEQETSPGRFEAKLKTEGVSNKTILVAMAEMGGLLENDKIDGYSLAMISGFEEEPTLYAIKKTADPVEVPTSIVDFTTGGQVGRSRTVVNEEGDEKSSSQQGYQPLNIEWMPESKDSLTLSGLGRYTSKLKFIKIEDSAERYFSSSFKASVQGARTDTEE